MHGGRGIDRSLLGIGLALVAGAFLIAWLALPSGAIAKKHQKGKGLALKFKGSTQSDQALLSSGNVSVVVNSSKKRKLVLAVRGFGGGPALTDPLGVKAKAGKKKSVSLPLSSTGREVLQGCGANSLLLTAQTKGKKSKHGKKPKKKKKGKSPTGRATLTHSVPQCDVLSRADRCEIIASPGTNCLFPFPSDHYAVPDSSTPTGQRLNLSDASTPANKNGVHVNPAGINTSDGFSPGESIVTRVPGLDNPEAFQKTGAVPLTDMDQAFAPNQPIVLIDASTGQRQLIWSEIDSTATSPDSTDLIIRPGRNLIEGHRYIVAMRNLKDAAGNMIPAPPGFALYRDGATTDVPAIEQRRAHFEDLFSKLQGAGIARGDLYDAWDFTVATTQNITQRMLSIRDRGLADLGDTSPGDGEMQGDAPGFTITNVTDFPDTTGHGAQNIREVTGTYEVPCFLSSGCSKPSGDVPARRPIQPGLRRPAAAERHDDRSVHLQHPALRRHRHGRRRLRRRPAGATVDVRARPLRRLHRGPHHERPPAGHRRRRAHLRHRLHRDDGGRRPDGDPGAPGPIQVPAAAGRAATGLPQLHLPGTAADAAPTGSRATRPSSSAVTR